VKEMKREVVKSKRSKRGERREGSKRKSKKRVS
jgi:hypothetical protein